MITHPQEDGASPNAVRQLTALMAAIDRRSWHELSNALHPDFLCRYVHTGEQFDRDSWIAVNENYPGFDRLVLEEITGTDDSAACRSHVTGKVENEIIHFECATFVQLRDGLIQLMTEVWTDVEQPTPEHARPSL